jgi:hypothetical protein
MEDPARCVGRSCSLGNGSARVSNREIVCHARPAQFSDVAALISEDLSHKLSCLNYVDEFCAAKDLQPFHKLYFAVQGPHASRRVCACATPPWLSQAPVNSRPRARPPPSAAFNSATSSPWPAGCFSRPGGPLRSRRRVVGVWG